jgi:16S rRNA (guanine966-N2)-methyltransferase
VTRIVGGQARGRRLVTPAGDATRPTSNRAREALFSALESERGPWAGAAFLDLFAGSGAVGLEAASRGAATVVLVESERAAWHACRENVAALHLPGVVLHRTDVLAFLAGPAPRGFDVVFADPPYVYPADSVTRALTLLATPGWCAPDAIAVVERAARDDALAWPTGWAPLRSRRYGEAMLWYGRYTGGALDGGGGGLWYGPGPSGAPAPKDDTGPVAAPTRGRM